MSILKQKIESLISRYWPSGVDVSNIDYMMLIPYVQDMRSLKRMVNAFCIDSVFARKRSGGRTYFGVDLGDFIAVSAMREFEKRFYDVLPNERWELEHACGCPYSDNSVDEAWMERHFFAYTSKAGREAVEKFVFDRLGVVKSRRSYDSKDYQYKLEYTDSADKILGYRLSSRLCFGGYFLSEFDDVQMSQEKVIAFLDSIENMEFPEKVIRDLDGAKQLIFTMYALDAQDLFGNEKVSEFYIRTLVRMGEMKLGSAPLPVAVGSVDLSNRNVYDRIFITLSRYCLKLKTKFMTEYAHGQSDMVEHRVGDVVRPILESEDGLTMLCHFIELDASRHENLNHEDADAWFSNHDYEAIETLYVKRVTQRQLSEGLSCHVSFFDLFRCWINILKKSDNVQWISEFSRANNKWLSDYTALSKILIFFSNDLRAAQNNPSNLTVDKVRLEKFFSMEQIKRIRHTLENAPEKQGKDVLFLDDMNARGIGGMEKTKGIEG